MSAPRSLAILILALSAISAGCSYTQQRLADLADIVGVGAGVGLGGNMRATQFVQLGVSAGGPRVKTVGRRVEAPTGNSAEFGIAPLMHFRGIELNGKGESRSIVLCRSLLDNNKDRDWQQWYDSKIWSFLPSMPEFESNYDRRFFDIGMAFYLGLGVELDFNPYELVDFFIGFTTLDISGDDEPAASVEQAAPAPRAGG